MCVLRGGGWVCWGVVRRGVTPERLRLAWFPAAFQGSVISDRCYLITRKWNCQCFFSFLFISDNSCNSDRIQAAVQFRFEQILSIKNTEWIKPLSPLTL